MSQSLTLSDLQSLLNPKWPSSNLTYTFIGPSNPFYYQSQNSDGTLLLNTIFPAAAIGNIKHVSTALESAFTSAVQTWTAVANISLTPTAVTDPVGDIAVGTIDLARFYKVGVRGLTAPTNFFDAQIQGDIWFDDGSGPVMVASQLSIGKIGYFSVLHEIGHALGLKGDSFIVGTQWDSERYSVMSYKNLNGQQIDISTTLTAPVAPLLFDIARVQFLYGANPNTNTVDNTYTFKLTGGWPIQAIWDAGGSNDTIDGSEIDGHSNSSNLIIDLHAGGESYVTDSNGARKNGKPEIHIAFQPLLLSSGLPDPTYNLNFIENAIGGSGDDTIIGNDGANNLNGGKGNDRIFGGVGNDVIVGGKDSGSLEKHDYLSGGDGNDTYRYTKDDGWDEIFDAAGTDVLVINNVHASAITDLKRFSDSQEPATMALLVWNGKVNGEEVVLTLKDGALDTGGTLVISGTALGNGGQIVLDGFVNGQFGITLDPASTTKSLTASQQTLLEGSADRFELRLAGFASGTERVRLSVNLDLANILFIVNGADTLSFNSNGTLELTLEAGRTTFNYALLSQGDVDADQSINLTATLLDTNGTPIGDASSLAISFDAVDESTVPNYTVGAPNQNIQNQDDATKNTNGWYRASGIDGGSWLSGGAVFHRRDTEVIAATAAIVNPATYQYGYGAVKGGMGDSAITGDDGVNVIYDDWEAHFDDAVGGIFGEYQMAPVMGNDSIVAGGGDDWIVTHGGDDTVLGGAGNDVIVDTHSGNEARFGANVTYNYGWSSTEWVEQPNHTSNDFLFGNEGNDFIAAHGGEQFMDGGDDNDELFAGAGDDVLAGGRGDDVLGGDVYLYASPYAGSYDSQGYLMSLALSGNSLVGDTTRYGNDVLDGEDGNDTLFGGGGDDLLIGGAGNDRLQGDFLFGYADLRAGLQTISTDSSAIQGNDTLYGGDGNDELWGGGGNDFLDGGAGTDTLRGGDGDDTFVGGAGVDLIVGDYANLAQGKDELHGGDDNDTLYGMGNDDRLYGDAGNDTLIGDNGSDPSLTGDDFLDGGDGGDILIGNGGNDFLIGGAGHDELQGNDGDDTFIVDAGNDVVYGDAGNDTLIVYRGAGSDALHKAIDRRLWAVGRRYANETACDELRKAA